MKIPATIITGFLGSGKTTMLTHLLAEAEKHGKKLAFLINEFGDLGIDGDIVKNCNLPGCEEDNVIELANGCICCTVADDFLPAMQKLLDRPNPPDHIVIETSGLALPKPLVKAFSWPDIRARATIDGVITVIDGPATARGQFADDPAMVAKQKENMGDGLDHDNPITELFSDQINCADLIIINKLDQMNPQEVKAAEAAIAEVSARKVPLLHSAFSKLDSKILLGLGIGAEDDLESRPSIHEMEGEDHDHDDFTSFQMDLPAFASIEEALQKLGDIAKRHDILRMKGFLAIAGKDMRLLIQGVGHRFTHQFDRPWQKNEKREGSLVVIGCSDMKKDAILSDMAVGLCTS